MSRLVTFIDATRYSLAFQAFQGQCKKAVETTAVIQPLPSVYDFFTGPNARFTVTAYRGFQVVIDLK
jgi:hypothetical protein